MPSKTKKSEYIAPLDKKVHDALLAMYDTPDPNNSKSKIQGYDKDHAERTTRIVLMAAKKMNINARYLPDFEAASLLHDIGRVGIDPELFGKIFRLAQEHNLPVRITDIRLTHPEISDSKASDFYLKLISPILKDNGIQITSKVIDHINMRMAHKERLSATISKLKPQLNNLKVTIKPWMKKVILFYYYPQLMKNESKEVHKLGMLLVACENFEAYNNRRRGRDYYCREKESLKDAFDKIKKFKDNGLISGQVLKVLQDLTIEGDLDNIIKESRGIPQKVPLPKEDADFKKHLKNILR